MSFDTNGADAFDPITGQPTQIASPEEKAERGRSQYPIGMTRRQ